MDCEILGGCGKGEEAGHTFCEGSSEETVTTQMRNEDLFWRKAADEDAGQRTPANRGLLRDCMVHAQRSVVKDQHPYIE